MEDNSIYNAIIASLAIGIIIVIITLIFAKPEPESFTELYFENHKELPKYVELGKDYNFQVGIHNLENKDVIYNYAITKEFYDINQCEIPKLYLEEKETEDLYADIAEWMKLGEMPEENEISLSTASYSNSIAGIINEDDYIYEFQYLTNSGSRQIMAMFKGVDEKNYYALLISEKTNEIFFLRWISKGLKITRKEIPLEKEEWRAVKINANKNNIGVFIGKKQIFEINDAENYTDGTFTLKSISTYAGFKNIRITEKGETRPVKISEDVKIEQRALQAKTGIEYDFYAETLNLMKNENKKIEINAKYYEDGNNINWTEYVLEYNFRGDKHLISFSNNSGFLLNEDTKEAFFIKKANEGLRITKKDIDIEDGINHKIKINIGKNVKISVDNKLIFEKEADAKGNLTFKTDGKGRFESIQLTNLNAPEKIRYNTGEEIKYIKQESFEEPSDFINWKDYIIEYNYKPKNKEPVISAFSALDNVDYQLIIDEEKNKLTYLTEEIKAVKPLDISEGWHNVRIEKTSNKLKIYFDNKFVFDITAADIAYGSIALKNADFSNVQVINKNDPNQKKVYIEEPVCSPIKIGEKITKGSIFLQDRQLEIIPFKFSINKISDYAKIQIALEGKNQEIHFWVARI